MDETYKSSREFKKRCALDNSFASETYVTISFRDNQMENRMDFADAFTVKFDDPEAGRPSF